LILINSFKGGLIMDSLMPKNEKTESLGNILAAGEIKDVVIRYRTGPLESAHIINHKNTNSTIYLNKRK